MDDTVQTPTEDDTPGPEENEEEYHKLGDDDSTKREDVNPRCGLLCWTFSFQKKKQQRQTQLSTLLYKKSLTVQCCKSLMVYLKRHVHTHMREKKKN